MHRFSLALLVASVIATIAAPARAVDPVPSLNYLTTGNSYGFQVFDTNRHRITEYLEHPYRYLRPNPSNPDGDGIVRRNLAFDVYFGVRAGQGAAWLAERTQEEVGYVNQTNVIRTMTHVGELKVETFFFAPYGYAGNALVGIITVTNEGGAAVDVQGFGLANFHMGSAPQPDFPGADGESIEFRAGDQAAIETGPGGGAMMYVGIGGVDHSSCALDVFNTVEQGDDIGDQGSCSGNDRANVFQKSLGSVAAGATASWGMGFLFTDDAAAVDASLSAFSEFVAGRAADAVLTDALAEWASWRTSVPPLTSPEQRVWRQAEAVLRMGQILEPWSENPKRKNHGMILASLPPGGWHTGWVRDSMYAIVALARMGHHAEAKAALDFYLDAEAGKYGADLHGVDYRISVVRYFGNGEEEADYSGSPTRNIEIDGWGMYLWAARVYLDASGDTAWLSETTARGDTVYDAIQNGVADALAQNLEESGMAVADASIWEVHWGNRQHYLYTTAAAARGFCDMAAIARRMEDTAQKERYAGLAGSAVNALETLFIDQNQVLAGTLEGLARGSNYHDGATVEAFTWNLIPVDSPIANASLNEFSYLQTPAGGYKRVEGSNDAYDIDEWILIDLRASNAFRRLGRADRADSLLDWVTRQASVNYDLLPELYNTRTTIGAYNGSIPMVGYGAGAYIITQLDRLGLYEASDCGTEDPVEPGADGGPDFSDLDAGIIGGGDGGGAPVGRTGTACLCSAPGGSVGAGGEILLGVVGVAMIWRRSRGRR